MKKQELLQIIDQELLENIGAPGERPRRGGVLDVRGEVGQGAKMAVK